MKKYQRKYNVSYKNNKNTNCNNFSLNINQLIQNIYKSNRILYNFSIINDMLITN